MIVTAEGTSCMDSNLLNWLLSNTFEKDFLEELSAEPSRMRLPELLRLTVSRPQKARGRGGPELPRSRTITTGIYRKTRTSVGRRRSKCKQTNQEHRDYESI